MKKESDLRVVKTIANLKESLLSLLKCKTISEITVKEICDGAKCSRDTFYMHYPYKEALYEQIVDECISTVQYGFRSLDRQEHESDKDYIDRSIHSFITSIYDAKDMLNSILTSDSTNTFCCRLTDSIRESMIKGGALQSEAANSETYQLVARYCSGGIVSFLLGWFEDTNMSVSEAESILRALHAVPFAVGYNYLKEHK